MDAAQQVDNHFASQVARKESWTTDWHMQPTTLSTTQYTSATGNGSKRRHSGKTQFIVPIKCFLEDALMVQGKDASV